MGVTQVEIFFSMLKNIFKYYLMMRRLVWHLGGKYYASNVMISKILTLIF